MLPEGVGHDTLSFEEGEIKITEPGFVYIYFSNENESRVEVFFDDFEVTHVKSPVVQIDDYYPFGLQFNSHRRENSTPNQYKYNGKEEQDNLGLGWFDYGARAYMPDVGRFVRPDIFAGSAKSDSPYNYAGNNPVNFVDLGGNFKFHPDFRRNYPRTTAWLEKVLPLFQNNQHIINTLEKHGFLSPEEIKSDLQNEQGPTISALDPEDGAWGRHSKGVPFKFSVGGNKLLDGLESGLATNNAPENKLWTDLHKFMVLITILHEYVHDGNTRKGKSLPVGNHPENTDQDEGDNWEIDALGRQADRISKSGGKSDNPRVKDTVQSFSEDSPIFFYLFINTAPHEGPEKKTKTTHFKGEKGHGDY